ncbi:AAA family ATPase [Micromonospora sp. CPCC 205558]|uniref:AAA family ATPase n=1 Tax=Micromonospora sp. CPCC 205558 TaxID=3122403 RepID=UPI002FF1FDB9
MAVDLGSELHPLLTTELIRLFHEPGTNPHGAQLIFNSHDVGLVRVRDGLDDVEGRYLRGRYGAVPFLDHELLDLLEDVVSANPFRELPVVRQAS